MKYFLSQRINDPVSAYSRLLVALIGLLLFSPQLFALYCATPGKDGAGGTLTGVINTYHPAVTAGTLNSGSSTVTVGTAVGSAAPISIGDKLLIIQMQAADLDSTNTNTYGNGVAGDPGEGATNITAGLYEYVVATSAGPNVTFQGLGPGNGLINTYYNDAATGTRGQRTYQIIRVPQYTTATLSSTLSVTPWNGATGGVLVMDVQGVLTLGGTVNMTGYGFRGGGLQVHALAGGPYPADYRTASTVLYHASKGEGLAGTPRYVYSSVSNTITNTGVEGYPNGSMARGAPGNAGGGGNDGDSGVNHNAGGGGGSNGGKGGTGGNTWNGNSAIGGFPGAVFAYSPAKMVMGGGGGAGASNNGAGVTSSGGSGGGIVMINAGSITGTGTITVDGGNGVSADNDGAGGGGAGGSVLMYVASGNFTGLTVNARGGNGGNAWPTSAPGAANINAHGPGGGGGGGVVQLSAGGATVNTAGGANGTTTTGLLQWGTGPGVTGTTTNTVTLSSIPGIYPGSQCLVMSGTVFDDVNYGGNSGRNYSTANTSAIGSGFAANAIASTNTTRVELYDSTGAYLNNVLTNASGLYSFAERAGSYQIRVVNSTVKSVRGAAGVSPVQTYRTDASTGTAVAVTNLVGGAVPSSVDAASNTTSATLATLNATAGIKVQSLAPVTTTAANVTGIDFGFNFDTIVNTNDSGQGSFRQFIGVANTLANTNLNQDSNGVTDPAAGVETSIFMLPTAALTGGVGVISVGSLLPSLTATDTHIDGRTQTANTTTSTGNANGASLGTGGSVGTGSSVLSTVAGPEIEIVDGAAVTNGINIAANNITVRGISIHGFGAATDTNADIVVSTASTGVNITGNAIGISAASYTLPAVDSGIGVYVSAGATVGISNNIIGFTQRAGVRVNSNAAAMTINQNEISNTGRTSLTASGIQFNNVSTATVTQNLIRNNNAAGIQFIALVASSSITDNTVNNNGSGGSVNPGILFQNTAAASSTVSRNIVSANAGSGILVETTRVGTTISQNSTFNNGQLGIDLHTSAAAPTGVSPYVTRNDNGDGDASTNNQLNYPVITSATISGGNLLLTGFSRPGATIEWFVADGGTNPSPTIGANFGEGRTYLFTTTEGVSDTDATTGTYGVLSCATASCTENRFAFSVPLPSGVSAGSVLTTTATLAGSGTSEFGAVFTVTGGGLLLVSKSSLTYSDPVNATTRPKAIPGATVIYTITVTNMGTGPIDAGTLVITDPIPANTSFVAGNFDGSTTGPIKFTNGTAPSGLTLTFSPGSEGTDDIDFATNVGVPVWGAVSTAVPITNIRIRPQGAMNWTAAAPNPSFTVQFKVTVN
jgi:uncharacterized repeat protein (TIGR01451 family)